MSTTRPRNGDGAKWRTVQTVLALFGAMVAVFSPAGAVIWKVAEVKQEQAVALTALEGRQSTALERMKGDLMVDMGDRLSDLERRQDEKFVSKEYLRSELDRALAQAVLQAGKVAVVEPARGQ